MASEIGSRHIHGWALSEEQAMNQEGRDQSSWNQPDLYHIMLCLAVARRASLFTCWWFCLHLNFSWSRITLIEGWPPRGWVEGLIFDEPPFLCLTPTDFISKFADLLTPSFVSAVAFIRLLLYPTVLCLLRRFEGISQVPGKTARSSQTFASSIASWNLWTLFEMFGITSHLWFCAWRKLNFRSCEYSSEICIEVLIWASKDPNLLMQTTICIFMKWNCWDLLLSYSIQSEFEGKTSNSKSLLHAIIAISSVWSWDARLNSIWSI